MEKGQTWEIVLFNLLAQRPTFNLHRRILSPAALNIAALLMSHNYNKCFEMFHMQVYKDTSFYLPIPTLWSQWFWKANEKKLPASPRCDLNNAVVLDGPWRLQYVSYTSWHGGQLLKERKSSQNQRWCARCPGLTALAWLRSLKLAMTFKLFSPWEPPWCAGRGSGKGLAWRLVVSTCCAPSPAIEDAARKLSRWPNYLYFVHRP